MLEYKWLERGDFWALWGRPELKSWRHSSQGSWRGRISVGTKSGTRRASNLKPILKGTGLQQEVLSPHCPAEVKALGEFIPESGVGPLRYWTARNKQTSFCSQPWPPPCGIQDVCVSSSLLCLNIVCGMTCEGGQLRRRELGSLGPTPCLLSRFFLTGSPSSSLLPHQFLGPTHPKPFPLRPQDPGAGSLQTLHSSDSTSPSGPNLSPRLFSSGLHHRAQSGFWLGTLLGLLRHSILSDVEFVSADLWCLGVVCEGWRY